MNDHGLNENLGQLRTEFAIRVSPLTKLVENREQMCGMTDADRDVGVLILHRDVRRPGGLTPPTRRERLIMKRRMYQPPNLPTISLYAFSSSSARASALSAALQTCPL
jgi:hypothetical protein